MGPGGRHLAVHQETDGVRAVQHERRGTGHHRGAVGPFGPQASGDGRLRVRVERRGRFRGEQHLRIGEQGPHQPHPLALAAGQAAAARVDGRAETVRQPEDDVVGGGRAHRPRDHVLGAVPAPRDQFAQRAREQVGLVVRHQDPLPHLVQRDLVQPDTAPGHVRRRVPAEPVQHGLRLRGPCPHQDRQPSRHDAHPGRGIVQHGRGHRGVQRVRGSAVGLQGQEPYDPPRGDHAPGELVAGLDEEVHRQDQHRDIAVHRHQLTDADGALRGEPGREPGHHGQEQGRQPETESLDPARHRADAVALVAQVPRVATERVREQRLPAQPVEDAQTARQIADPRRQHGLPLPVVRLGALEAAHQRPDEQRDQRHPEQDRHRQRHRHGQQQRGHHPVRHDRGDPGPDDGQRHADRLHVTHADRHDLTGPDLPRQRRPQPDRVLHHHLDRPEVAVHPDLGHRAVPDDTQPRVEHPGAQHRRRPAGQRRPVTRLQTVVDRPRQQIRRQGQEPHPHRRDHRPGGRAARLADDQPPQVPPAAPPFRGPRIRVRVDHPPPRPAGPPSYETVAPRPVQIGEPARARDEFGG